MIHQRLLQQAVQGRDPILVEFVDRIAPNIIQYFAAVPALGGSGQPVPHPDFEIPGEARAYEAKELEKFSRSNPDQSMATHLLNGIFAAMPLAARLPAAKALSDEEKRLWILGYVAHDYTKIYGLKVGAGSLDVIRLLIQKLGESLGFGDFLPSWQDFLDDIAWLAQNTQTVVGANLDLGSFSNLRTHPRRLDILRMLSSIADILVHVRSPSEVVISPAERKAAENLSEKLAILFGVENAPRLTYHQLSEVRGLVSNLINNAVMDAMVEHDCEPYLFFPNGVVYLTSHSQFSVDMEALKAQAWNRLVDVLTSDEEVGIKRAGTGLKVAPALYELVDVAALIRIGQRAAMSIRNTSAANRLDAQRVRSEGLATDVRTDRLAEFLIFIKRRVMDELFPKATGVASMLLSELGLNIEPEETEAQKGGVLTGWWYAAAKYLAGHGTIDDYGLEQVLERVGARTLAFIEEQHLKVSKKAAIVDAFGDYLQNALVIDRSVHNAPGRDFNGELQMYTERKARNKPICSLCSSPYEAIEQPETAVLFKPQQYSNKTRLGSNMLRRGICPICTIEMMLRLIQQGAPGKGFQDQRPVTLWFYPTYFFTNETANIVKTYIGELEDLNLYALLNHLRKEGFSTAGLMSYPGFMRGEEATHSFTIVRQQYSEHDLAALFSFALRPLGKHLTDTDAWIVPTLYALALPLLLNVKIVASQSFIPLFASGADFRETAVLDAPHSFSRYALGQDRFHVDELPAFLVRLLRFYDLHLDVTAEPTDAKWPQLNALVRDVVTDPNYVFAYYERKERNPKKKALLTRDTIQRYIQIYQALGGDTNMGLIGDLVDLYACFYRAKYGKLDSAYAVLKPLAEANDAVLECDPKTQTDDLVLFVAGAIGDLMERVWGGQADGYDPIVFAKGSELSGTERRALSRQKQMDFARFFVEEAFLRYSEGDRGVLRERFNRMRSAARFYYLSQYGYSTKEADHE